MGFMTIICLSVVSQGQSPLRFDRAWWLRTNGEEQQGFIYGYLDRRQPPGAAKASTDDYEKSVSEQLEAQRTGGAHAVTIAIEKAGKTLKSRDVRGGEIYRGPHGFLDGAWWGGFQGQPWPARLAKGDKGYLEGYLECSTPPVYTQRVLRYQAALNRHFASGLHEQDKIADVVQASRHSR